MTIAPMLLSLVIGASMVIQPSSAGSTQDQRFDCHDFTITWTDEWKAWCCEEEGVFCSTTTVLPYFWMGPYQSDIPGIGLGGITVPSLDECKHRCYISPLCQAIQYSNLETYQSSNCFQFASNDDTGKQYRTFEIYKLFRYTTTITSTSSTTTSGTSTTKTATTSTVTTWTTWTTTTTRTASTDTTTTHTVTTIGCNANCSAGGRSGSCGDQIGYTMEHNVDLLERANKWGADVFQENLCKAAGEIVQNECPHCESCTIKDWCHGLTTQTTTPMLGCQTDCVVGVSHGTCEQRMRWAMVHDTQVAMSNNSCEAAVQKTLLKCPNCNVCDGKSWCVKEDLANSFFKKFEVADADPPGFLDPKGSSRFLSASVIMMAVVAGAIFAMVAYRRSSRRASVHYADSFAHPLCQMSDEQLSSEAA